MSSGEIIRIIVAACAAYMIGNINPAIIIGKLKGIDIRKEGSGNAGMTNTIRVMGLGAGITVFIVDVMKAFIAVKLGYSFCGAGGAMAAFAGVVLGHCFPAVFGFKGGKGVASAFGAALALNWPSACAALVVAGIIAKGKTEIYNLEYLDRGYENIEEKFRNLGAKIERVTE